MIDLSQDVVILRFIGGGIRRVFSAFGGNGDGKWRNRSCPDGLDTVIRRGNV
jgi:hypothetical protein